MKDNRFIELVNLYIDRQITAAETAELEAEMQSNPQRRAVYRQYCRLHSATKQVYHSFRADAHGPQRVVQAAVHEGVGQDLVFVLELDAEHRVGQHFRDGAAELDQILFCH